ncbi:diacylglycerol kinase family lipid kinase [Candidatus Poribacteria bacterium]|nr:diacylglycerol kinase family lipid kinase [Candidatus Poribacteria bacterium]MYK93924.1 diacylglycerol kinase family lipid kinase [Candidatus Poribacteria bacterium]
MNDFILIANPISGKGHAKNVAEQGYAALTESGKQGQLILTSASGDAKRFAQEAVADGTRYVIACGGDGTLHEVVNGIAMAPDVTLGVLPCGRGNDFAAAVGIPLKPEAAIATLLSGTPIRVDLGRCYQNSPQLIVNSHQLKRDLLNENPLPTTDNRQPTTISSDNRQPTTDNYFTTIATCGYDTEVSRRAAKGTPLFAGTASYAYAAVETLFYYDPPAVCLEGDFGTYEGPLLLAATGITSRYGGGFQIVPNARIDDGLFDVCIVRPVSSLTVLRLLVTLFWGGHVGHPAVSMHQTRTLKIETDPPILLYADGEPMCETPATIEIIKDGLTVMTPRGM